MSVDYYRNDYDQMKSFEKQMRDVWAALPASVQSNVRLFTEDTYQLTKVLPSDPNVHVVIKVPFFLSKVFPTALSVDFTWFVNYQPAFRSAAWAFQTATNDVFKEGMNFKFWETNGSDDFLHWTPRTSGYIRSIHTFTSSTMGEYRFFLGKTLTVVYPRK